METPKKNPTPNPPPKSPSPSKGAGLGQLEALLDQYLVQKAPALPAGLKEAIVNFAPWITIIAIALALPAILALFGLRWLYTPLYYWGYRTAARVEFIYILTMAFLAVTLVLRILALPGLFKKTRGGWKLVYYSVLVNAVYSLLSYQIVGCIIGTLLGLYVVFQIKSYYK